MLPGRLPGPPCRCPWAARCHSGVRASPPQYTHHLSCSQPPSSTHLGAVHEPLSPRPGRPPSRAPPSSASLHYDDLLDAPPARAWPRCVGAVSSVSTEAPRGRGRQRGRRFVDGHTRARPAGCRRRPPRRRWSRTAGCGGRRGGPAQPGLVVVDQGAVSISDQEDPGGWFKRQAKHVFLASGPGSSAQSRMPCPRRRRRRPGQTAAGPYKPVSRRTHR